MANLQTVESFIDPIAAYLAKGRLETEGIPAFVAHEYHIWANWGLSNALGGVKIQVAEENIDIAKGIIQQHLNGEFEIYLDHPFYKRDIRVCPHCNSSNYEGFIPLLSKILLFLSFGILNVIYKLRETHYQCASCYYKWQE